MSDKVIDIEDEKFIYRGKDSRGSIRVIYKMGKKKGPSWATP